MRKKASVGVFFISWFFVSGIRLRVVLASRESDLYISDELCRSC